MKNFIKNKLSLSGDGVWFSHELKPIEYSDGREVEEYLREVLGKVDNLSSDSDQLASSIIDWPSQYHLSPLRANLLRPFKFKGGERVLEVGAGCGAITRFLGENFTQVIAVEGSMERARLARMRTSEQENVSIVCAAFQDLVFYEKFDLIFCVGVFEYSPTYIKNENPFNTVLNLFKGLLNKNGSIFLGIENQFGSKYFTSSPEDHTGLMYDGLEGYPRRKIDVRTFGRNELSGIISNYFSNVEFYYPYPDYKLPSCVLKENFLDSFRPVELIGRYKFEEWRAAKKNLFNEMFFLEELSRNGMLKFFSNSFLVIASQLDESIPRIDGLGVLYNSERVEKFQTVTTFCVDDDDCLQAVKKLKNGASHAKDGFLELAPRSEPWIEGCSLSYILLKSLYVEKSFSEFSELCMVWTDKLKILEDEHGAIPGNFFDANWSNFIVRDGKGTFYDLEWSVEFNLDFKFLTFKSAVNFLDEIYGKNCNSVLPYATYIENLCSILINFGFIFNKKEIIEKFGLLTIISFKVYGEKGHDYIINLNESKMHKTIFYLKKLFNIGKIIK